MIYTQSHTPETCSYTHSIDTSKCRVHQTLQTPWTRLTQIGLRAQHKDYKNCHSFNGTKENNVANKCETKWDKYYELTIIISNNREYENNRTMGTKSTCKA